MAGRERQLKVRITGDERDLSRALKGTDSTVSKWSRSLSTFAKGAALGLAGVGVAAVKFGFDFVEAAEESVKIGKQTAAVIKSTGGVARVTADQVGKLAEKLSLKAGIDDELIQSGENVLLTFTNIRNEVGKGNDIFNQASAIALDMSVALGTDLQSAVVQVGKALNDPIAGLTGLTKAGVQFTDQQKEQIKALVESGDLLGAQKIILGELTTQFAGSAEAQATASDKLKVAFGNISEQIGAVLLPYVNQFSDWLVAEGIPLLRDELIPWVQNHLLPALGDFAALLRDDILPALQTSWDWLGRNKLALEGVTIALGALAAAYIAVKLQAIAAAIAAAAVWASAALPVVALIALIGGALVVAYLLLEEPINYIRDHWRNAWDSMISKAKTAVEAVVGFFTALPGRVAGALGRLANLFGSAMRSAWNQVTDWVDSIVDAILSIPRRIAGVAGKIKDKLTGALGGLDLTPGFDLPGFGGLFAEGGVIPGPAGAPRLIVGHGGEVVIPPGAKRYEDGSIALPGGWVYDPDTGQVRRKQSLNIARRSPAAVVPRAGEFAGSIGLGAAGGGPVINVFIDRPVVASEHEFREMVRRAVNDGLARGAVFHKHGRPVVP